MKTHDEYVGDPLAQPLVIGKVGALLWLRRLLEHYEDGEARIYKQLWGTPEERDASAWSEGLENEWMRYRQEAAALRAGIAAIEASP